MYRGTSHVITFTKMRFLKIFFWSFGILLPSIALVFALLYLFIVREGSGSVESAWLCGRVLGSTLRGSRV